MTVDQIRHLKEANALRQAAHVYHGMSHRFGAAPDAVRRDKIDPAEDALYRAAIVLVTRLLQEV